MDLNSALLSKPAAGEAAPRRAPVVPVVLLLAIGVLSVTATIPDELMTPGSALRAATLRTSSAAVLQLAWVLPPAAMNAAAVFGNRLPHLGAAGGDLVAAIAGLSAASGSVGLAQYAASYEGAGWPWSPRYVTVVAASFLGFPALLATFMLDRLHAAACERNIEF